MTPEQRKLMSRAMGLMMRMDSEQYRFYSELCEKPRGEALTEIEEAQLDTIVRVLAGPEVAA